MCGDSPSGKQWTGTKKLANGADASALLQAGWTYDGEGRPRNVQYPVSGPTYQYSWDARGMPSRLQNLSSGADVVASVVYGPAGEMTSMTMGSGGGTEGRAYNVNGQLTTLTLPGRTVTYTFPGAGTNNGKVASITDSGETVNYSYDSLNRLTSASVVSGWSQTFAYDGFGNLTSKIGSNALIPTWNPANAVNPANNRLNGVTYDANGNQETIPMTAGMTDAFTASYDIENRMIQMVNAAQTMRSEYDYDPSNKRVWERRTGNGGGEWVYFSSDEALGRYALTVGVNSISLSQDQGNVWFGDKLVQKVANGSTIWPMEDRLSSIGLYLPYGENKPGSSNPPNDNRKFASYFRDGGTGIDNAGYRWYLPGIGRFATGDPYNDRLDREESSSQAEPSDPSNPTITWNRYSYAGNDGVNQNDPDGLTINIPPVVQGPAPTCVGAMWDSTLRPGGWGADLNLALLYFLNSPEGHLGVTLYFETRPTAIGPDNSSSPQAQAMLGVGFVAINRYLVGWGAERPNFSLQQVIIDMDPGHENWSRTGFLNPGRNSLLVSTMNSSPDSPECLGLRYSFSMAQSMVAATLGTQHSNFYHVNVFNPVGPSLFYISDTRTPHVGDPNKPNLYRTRAISFPAWRSIKTIYFWALRGVTPKKP